MMTRSAVCSPLHKFCSSPIPFPVVSISLEQAGYFHACTFLCRATLLNMQFTLILDIPKPIMLFVHVFSSMELRMTLMCNLVQSQISPNQTKKESIPLHEMDEVLYIFELISTVVWEFRLSIIVLSGGWELQSRIEVSDRFQRIWVEARDLQLFDCNDSCG